MGRRLGLRGGVLARFADGRRARADHPRLDLHQRRGHHKKLARDVDINRGVRGVLGAGEPEAREEREVLVGDPGDGDVVDVQLVLADEKQEQVQRTFEVLEPYAVVLGEHGLRLV